MFGKRKDIKPKKNQSRIEDPLTKDSKKASRRFKFSFARKPKEEKKATKKSRFRLMRAIVSLLDGSMLKSDFAMRNAPLAFFIFAWILIAIANNYMAQRKAKHIDQVKREIKDLRDEYISTKSQLMYSTKMSEVARKLQSRGIKEPIHPPFKLKISEKEGNNE